MNYAPTNHVSFFNEVATRSKPSSIFLISFLEELDIGKTMLRPILIIEKRKAGLPEVALPMGDQSRVDQNLMPPKHC